MEMDAACAERLEAQVRRLRADGALGRSDTGARLFDFLLTQTLQGRSPKEVEIAQDVFHKDGGFDVMLDASVRVYVHRLRRKIEEYYAACPEGGDRLFIPKGEYRLALAVEPVSERRAEPSPPHPRWRLDGHVRPLAIVATLLLVANVAAWLVLLRPGMSDTAAQAAASDVWQSLAANGRPTVLASGDRYMFGEKTDSPQISRLVRQDSIDTRSDLEQYLAAHPADVGRYVDVGLHYLPTSVAPALRDVLPVLRKTIGVGMGKELMIPMSRVTPDMLKKANIVYIGDLGGLGLLRDPVFAISGFQAGSSYATLTDRRTGQPYVSDQADPSGSRQPRRDFAYLAGLPGPSGTRVLIVGGTRDAAVMQAAEIASDRRQLDAIAGRAGGARAFEALYEVQTLDDLNIGSKLIVARGLPVDRLWISATMRPSSATDLRVRVP